MSYKGMVLTSKTETEETTPSAEMVLATGLALDASAPPLASPPPSLPSAAATTEEITPLVSAAAAAPQVVQEALANIDRHQNAATRMQKGLQKGFTAGLSSINCVGVMAGFPPRGRPVLEMRGAHNVPSHTNLADVPSTSILQD